jgi:hypothetical protein
VDPKPDRKWWPRHFLPLPRTEPLFSTQQPISLLSQLTENVILIGPFNTSYTSQSQITLIVNIQVDGKSSTEALKNTMEEL